MSISRVCLNKKIAFILFSISILAASNINTYASQKCKYESLQHPLHEAAINNDVADIKCLLSKGIDINSIGATGETALSRAAYGRYAAFQTLLARGASFTLGSPKPLENTFSLLYNFTDGKDKTKKMHSDGIKILNSINSREQFLFVYFKDNPERFHNLLTKVCDRHNYKYISKDLATFTTVFKTFKKMGRYVDEASRKNYLIMSKMSVASGLTNQECINKISE